MTIRLDIRGSWESAILSQLPLAVPAKKVLEEDSQYLWANHYAAHLKKEIGVHTRSELYAFALNQQLLQVAPFINLKKKKLTWNS